MKNNILGWFEIPVADMDRAIHFYQTVLGITLERRSMNEMDMAWFPFTEESPGAPGSLISQNDFYIPSRHGVLIYLSSPSGDLKVELDRVEQAGGKVLQQKELITEEIGYMGLFLDSEGNRIALHSHK